MGDQSKTIGPNPIALKRNMRRAGWRGTARNLETRLADRALGGVPLRLRAPGELVVVRYAMGAEAPPGTLVAFDVVTGLLIATQEGVRSTRLPVPGLASRYPEGSMRNVTMRWPASLRAAVEKHRPNESFAEAVRDIVTRYLKAAGVL